MSVQLDITAFGFEGRNVKINMKVPIPVGVNIGSWIMRIASDIVKDVKHSGKWLCSECGKPARETQFDIMSWLPQEPRVVIYVHQLCEANGGACDQSAKAESNVWRRDAGQPPNPPSSATTRAVEPALSRSCAICHRDPFQRPELKLKRCGRCKWIRYCSVECQTADYRRHKKVCKNVVRIEYGKWDVDDRD
ncbi:hypothetical protein C8R43DRAFT_201046 [Mycena crocata]|nr:hypothetical protein C8R43DRAFT_201046 [Mycena crocata]